MSEWHLSSFVPSSTSTPKPEPWTTCHHLPVLSCPKKPSAPHSPSHMYSHPRSASWASEISENFASSPERVTQIFVTCPKTPREVLPRCLWAALGADEGKRFHRWKMCGSTTRSSRRVAGNLSGPVTPGQGLRKSSRVQQCIHPRVPAAALRRAARLGFWPLLALAWTFLLEGAGKSR